ncbi:hypothetical protein C0J52_04911 [Blattella germanica]|nr:hypothetical protein C0J52_04911 [Blattella germanica]
MAKKSHNKFLRQERAKVKLKAKKTLTKAKNVTDTSFKVRKIVLPSQLQAFDVCEVTTRKKQNIKELLAKLNHYNVAMKKSSLEGLNELLMYYPNEVVGLHLSKVIEGIARLILDEDKGVRRASIKLIEKVLTQVPDSKISPFFNVLMSYLACGMTDIHITVQDDALLMLDSLLTSVPTLVAASSEKILTNFLNMISSQKTESRPGRTLSVNLGSIESIRWDPEKELNIPLHYPHYARVCYLPGIFGNSFEGDDNYNDGSHLKNYVKVVMPLLMDAWLEVRPEDVNIHGSGSLLSKDGALLLMYVLKIICLLLELLELWDFKSEVPEVIAAYKKDFLKHIFPGFPYSFIVRMGEKTMGGRKSKDSKQDFINLDPKCENQNLAICKLFFSFFERSAKDEDCERVLKFIKGILRNWKRNDNTQQLLEVLKSLVAISTKRSNKQMIHVGSVLDDVLRCYMETRDKDFLEILCEITLSRELTYLHSNDNLKKWLEFLPTLLCSSSISASVVKHFIILTAKGNPFFYSSLCRQLPDILNNLNSISVTGAKSDSEGRKSLVNILYWIQDWSPEACKTLQKHLKCDHWDQELTAEIIHLLNEKASDNLMEVINPAIAS